MNSFLELVSNPVFGALLIVFGPLAIALIYRRWHCDGWSRANEPAVQSWAIDDLIQANRSYTRRFDLQGLPARPVRKLAVVTCMDARLPVERLLGLKPGEAHIIRNAGGIVTEDAIRSLLVSHYQLGTQEFLIINHTDCGMMTFKDEELSARLQRLTGKKTAIAFHAFRDLDGNVRRQVQQVKAHPWMPKDVPVRGFVYDVRNGLLREVADGMPVKT